jgi:hypothetical protein
MLEHLDTPLEPGIRFTPENCFEIADRADGKGKAVYSLQRHRRGELIARFTGEILPYRTQHTLQINPSQHVLDLNFVGYLAHSCSPNVFLDMQTFGTALTMDYAATEDVLHKQFRCLCGSPGCRLWITGRKERVNAEGRRYLDKLKTC